MKFDLWDLKIKIDLLSKIVKIAYLNSLIFFFKVKKLKPASPRMESELDHSALVVQAMYSKPCFPPENSPGPSVSTLPGETLESL